VLSGLAVRRPWSPAGSRAPWGRGPPDSWRPAGVLQPLERLRPSAGLAGTAMRTTSGVPACRRRVAAGSAG